MMISMCLKDAILKLSTISETPHFEAELLLAHVMNVTRTYLHTWPSQSIPPEQLEIFSAMLHERLSGAPMAYLLKQQSFWTLDLDVTPHVLIPRPETEGLVELTLSRFDADKSYRILDLGTGSGAIACAIAKSRPHWHITATDIDPNALEIAHQNSVKHGLHNIEFIQSEWFSELNHMKFDAICSNPPYLAQDEMTPELRFEPLIALVAGPTGLEAFADIIGKAHAYLNPNGWLFLEHGYTQATAVTLFLAEAGFYAIVTEKDLSGLPRITAGQTGEFE